MKLINTLLQKVLNDLDGIYTYNYEAERKEDCVACSQIPKDIEINNPKFKLKDLIELLCERPDLQMKNPGLTACIDGRNKTLYMQTVPSIEEKTRENLTKTLVDLGLVNGSEINVADITTPNAIVLKLRLAYPDTDMS